MKRRICLFVMFVCLSMGWISNGFCIELENWDAMRPLWIDAEKTQPGMHVAFRGKFDIDEAGEFEIRFLGASWFNIWIDDEFVTEGPARFPADHPEYDKINRSFSAGEHVISTQVHYLGVDNRILDDVQPFWACEIYQEGKSIPVVWRCTPLTGYEPRVRRINPQLGWIEWCDTRQIPLHWREIAFDDSSWTEPVSVKPRIGQPEPLSIDSVRCFSHLVQPIAEGPLAEIFGYERDDIPARFYLRDLECKTLPAQGVWRRYDVGRVRLMRPRFVLDVPAGTVIEFAYNETLSQGRVSPYINLSAGPSCNLDHYVARGGEQEFFPLMPRGGRFIELHVFADPAQVKWIREEFIERGYYDSPEGSFHCGDVLLEQIWMTGIETFRGCCEDAVIDNPTRERGEWTGDVSTVAMDIASVGYGDIRLCRRALEHSASCAREDGLVAGLCPGGEAYIPSYAAQWISGCIHYWQLTGDRALLEELFPYAERNMTAFETYVTEDGLTDGLGWVFIDWGYVRNSGPADMALNFHYLAALRDMIRWCDQLGRNERIAHYREVEKKIYTVLSRWLEEKLQKGKEAWNRIGYHCAVLGLRAGFFKDQNETDCVSFIKNHILRCFPNDPTAPRNCDPGHNHPQLITPYFAYYAFPLLIERGEMDFVLDQYRKCWGWALQEGRTTWIEVFDPRWSHCHQWSGCPTPQLSRYALGLHPRFDLGKNHFALSLKSGSLQHAEGTIPLIGDAEKGSIQIQWAKEADGIHYRFESSAPISLHTGQLQADGNEEILRIDRVYQAILSK